MNLSEGDLESLMSVCSEHRVLVVDDDENMRSALYRALCPSNSVETYVSGLDLIERADLDKPGCCLLDYSMPGMSGADVQDFLGKRDSGLSVIFLTGTDEVRIAVNAMRQGAADFLQKPFERGHLLQCVRSAAERSERLHEVRRTKADLLERASHLTRRERKVLELLAVGHTSKEIACSLGGSHRTVEVHRSNIMRKMHVSSSVELIGAALECAAPPYPRNQFRSTAATRLPRA